MTTSSRFSTFAAFCFVALLGSTGCNKNSANDSQRSQDTATPASATKPAPEVSAAHKADNLATEKVEADRNDKQLSDDEKAHAAYGVSTKERLAKIDADLAKLAPTSKNAAGLKARRDQIATRLGEMPSSVDATWVSYTRDVNAKLDGIERDLRAAR